MKSKLLVGVFLLVCIFSVQTNIVFADSYEIKNDGKEKKAEDLYGDSGLPSSFKDCKYYDVSIPYDLTAKDIGGYCSKTSPCGTMHAMGKSVIEMKQGTGIQYEGNWDWAKRGISTFNDAIVKHTSKHWVSDLKNGSSEKSSVGIEIVQDKNGTKYLLTAVQPYFFSGSSNGKDGFPKENGGTSGQIIDAICTDGTVIHMLCIDINAVEHTNGGNGKLKCDWSCGKHHPDMAKLSKKQYRNLFSACNGNQLELIFGGGSYSKAASAIGKLGLGSKRKLAYYRVYNKKLKDAPNPVSVELKECMTNLGETKIVKEDAPIEEKEKAKGVATGAVYKETDFVQDKGMKDMMIEFKDSKSLNDDDLYNLKTWQGDIEKDGTDNFLIIGGRWIVLLFGIIFEIWMLLMYLAYWFDRLNNFFDIDVLKIMSFGRLVTSPTEEECTFSVRSLGKGETRTINHRHMVMVCIFGLAFGTLIISGTLFDIVNGIVQGVLNFIN